MGRPPEDLEGVRGRLVAAQFRALAFLESVVENQDAPNSDRILAASEILTSEGLPETEGARSWVEPSLVEISQWIQAELKDLWSPDEVKVWLNLPHELLDGSTPGDRITKGKGDEVLVLIDQIKNGAYLSILDAIKGGTRAAGSVLEPSDFKNQGQLRAAGFCATEVPGTYGLGLGLCQIPDGVVHGPLCSVTGETTPNPEDEHG